MHNCTLRAVLPALFFATAMQYRCVLLYLPPKARCHCRADDEWCTGGVIVMTVLCAIFATIKHGVTSCFSKFRSIREIVIYSVGFNGSRGEPRFAGALPI